MDRDLKSLIQAIVSYANERDSYVSKTKLLKLLYLFDVEWFRAHRTIYTGFEWKYHLLGPWTSQYDEVLDTLIARRDLERRTSSDPGFDTEFLETDNEVNLDKLFDSYKDEVVLRKVLRIWGEKATPEILDYVYFRTEPMQRARSGEKLDFSSIGDAPLEYRRAGSGKTKQQIEALRKKAAEQLAIAREQRGEPATFTPPKYDDEFLEAMDKLETMK